MISEDVYQSMQRATLQSSFHNIPAYKNPIDAWRYHEILWKHAPTVVIEIGNYAGGSLAFLRANARPETRFIGVDVTRAAFLLKDLNRIHLIDGDGAAVVAKVAETLTPTDRVMVIEDSSHREEQCLSVLRAYAPLVSRGQYLICEDTIVNHGLTMPWPDGGPMAAVRRFIAEHPEFVVEPLRFPLSWNPEGYLLKR
jgi:cephalosporin hydroxylase